MSGSCSQMRMNSSRVRLSPVSRETSVAFLAFLPRFDFSTRAVAISCLMMDFALPWGRPLLYHINPPPCNLPPEDSRHVDDAWLTTAHLRWPDAARNAPGRFAGAARRLRVTAALA